MNAVVADRRLRMLVLGALLMLGAMVGLARAADPARFSDAGISDIPIEYYQGVTSNPSGDLYFDGVNVGLYKTDSQLHEVARNGNVIPAAVAANPGFNHIGDISFDDANNRVLLPLECYSPFATPSNTCGIGGVGVADPDTLQWKYWVKLNPTQIPKAMFNEVSPNGSLLWTSSGPDLIAFDVSDIKASNAVGTPGAQVLQKSKTIAGGVPVSGITGATFFRGRLYMAGQNNNLPGKPMQVWSEDVSLADPVAAKDSLRLEIEKDVVGESEGLDTFYSLGGSLHWQIQPIAPGQIPTYSQANGTLLHFNPEAPDVVDTDHDGFTDAADGTTHDGDTCPVNASNMGGAQIAGPCGFIPADPLDADHDGYADVPDNCVNLANNDQANTDRDLLGDACDPDNDNDAVLDGADNCRYEINADQANHDNDSRGDACDLDDDNDVRPDAKDNCRTVANNDQMDADKDGIGDACDTDADNDGASDAADNCRVLANPDQANADSDADGDACDADDDNDGLSDQVEAGWRTSSVDLDSDDDGIRDGAEDRNRNGKLDKGETNPRKADTDKDGLADGLEKGIKKGVKAPSGALGGTLGKRFHPDRDPKTKTNPRKADTDGDGRKDGREDRNHNGRVDKRETNPRKKDA